MTRRYPPNMKRPKIGQVDWRKLAPLPTKQTEPKLARDYECMGCGKLIRNCECRLERCCICGKKACKGHKP